MFDIPLVISNKRIRAARKLRYQYCNNLSRKYNINQGITEHGLPTPENSAAEISENEEASQKKTRRLKRRWRTIIGESYSDCDTEEEEEEEEEEIDEEQQFGDNANTRGDDQERLFFKKYEKPQISFEKWQDDPKKRTAIQRHKISFSKLNRIQKHSKRNMEKSLMFASQKNKDYFDTISQGLEYIDPQLGYQDNFQIKHIQILNTLLQLHVSRHNWDLAYKCFVLLIRIPRVDIRELWGIGERILSEREPMKSVEFLEWMTSVYSSRIKFTEEVNYQTAPVFSKGSKNHVPQFTITMLWQSLLNCSKHQEEELDMDNFSERDPLQNLIEKISELLLGPPYMEASEIWFIYALCHTIKADKLSSQFNLNLTGSARDIATIQVFQHIQNAKTFLQTCSSKGDFHFPQRYIERQLESFGQRLQETDDQLRNGAKEDPDVFDNLDTQAYSSEDSSSDITESSD